MKISIREALFAGDEVDAWEAPKSEWIVAVKMGRWVPEIKNSPKYNPTDDLMHGLLGMVTNFQRGSVTAYKRTENNWGSSGGGLYYYNESLDELVYFDRRTSEDIISKGRSLEDILAVIEHIIGRNPKDGTIDEEVKL